VFLYYIPYIQLFVQKQSLKKYCLKIIIFIKIINKNNVLNKALYFCDFVTVLLHLVMRTAVRSPLRNVNKK
jgi:hypothetical protein